jgi:hypothetical protein
LPYNHAPYIREFDFEFWLVVRPSVALIHNPSTSGRGRYIAHAPRARRRV